MSKVEQTEQVPRGTKLIPEIIDPLSRIDTELSDTNVTRDQLEKKSARFHVDLWLPVLDGIYFEGLADRSSKSSEDMHWLWAFCLPLAHEFWNFSGSEPPTTPEEAPETFIDGAILSWDQRSEGGAITSESYSSAWSAALPPTDMTFGGRPNTDVDAARLDLTVTIWEKDQLCSHPDGLLVAVQDEENYQPDRIVAQETVPGIGVAAGTRRARANPVDLKALKFRVKPHCTYIVGIRAAGLAAVSNDDRYALPSLHLDLYGATALIPRDENTGSSVTTPVVCNMPILHHGLAYGPAVATSKPGAGTGIEAETADGVQTNIDAIDEVIRRGHRGGYDRHAANPGGVATLKDDAAMDLIVIPMCNNQRNQEINRANYTDLASYFPGSGGDSLLQFWGEKPITYPFVVHHVYALINWQSYQKTLSEVGYGQDLETPAAGSVYTVRHHITVGIESDGDTPAQEAIANFSGWVDTANSGSHYQERMIDRIGYPFPYAPANGASGAPPGNLALDLIAVPLLDHGTKNGPGYKQGAWDAAQGEPVFVGRADHAGKASANGPRTYINYISALGASPTQGRRAPRTEGAEKRLVCSWSLFTDSGDWATVPQSGVGYDDALFMGYGGGFVMVVGKKVVG